MPEKKNATDSQGLKVNQLKYQKRILMTNINSLLGSNIYENMRNDMILKQAESQQEPHRFIGTLNAIPANGILNPSPSESIKILDSVKKPNTFIKQVKGADIIILDLTQFNFDMKEAELLIKSLKYNEQPSEKDQVLIVVSSPMSWSNTPSKDDQSPYLDNDKDMRVPLPKYLPLKQLEQTALALAKNNPRIRVHVVSAGFLYGNGEQNDIFYEFFRRAWVSLHPKLAALPVIEEGSNILPIIHVSDLVAAIDLIVTSGQKFQNYLIAVDQSTTSTQKEIMTAISEGIGSGATQQVQIQNIINEPWCELLQVNIKLEASSVLKQGIQWKSPNGINQSTMEVLNVEFNHYRGLFPLKIFITGPPCSGKTYFCSKLSEQYGVPHIKIYDLIQQGLQANNNQGKMLRQKIEELKDQEQAEYEKTRKKKDPDFDRANFHPRLPDDILHNLVKDQLNSAGCMNKGFILDGFPRSKMDASEIFQFKIQKTNDEGEQIVEHQLNEKILPQYTIIFESDDAYLISKAKELPQEKLEGSHWNDAGMIRRIKEYRARNIEDSKDTVKEFFTEHIGYQNVLLVDCKLPEKEKISKMEEIIEQKGKPCCINMISNDDKKFLQNLQKYALKEARAKAKAEAGEGAEGENQDNSEEEVDEIDQMIMNELIENQERQRIQEAEQKQKALDEIAKKIKEEKEAVKLEKLRQQERDLLDQRSQPIRQYLMDNVVPHLTEGLIDLCKDIPDDPVDYLANFLLKKADEIDERIIREREEAAAAKLEQKKLKF